jgi:DNA repair ATPase RecN
MHGYWMIKSIAIANFQSHLRTKLDLSEGVNVIVGPSDGGKSAIFRAINWVLTNRPLGDDFRSNRGGETAVTISVDDLNVTRAKDDQNLYEILDSSFYVTTLRAFGTDVPEEITKILNMGKINMQSQMDAPFLLADSSGEVARTLNQIVNLEEIDASLSEASKRIRSIETSYKMDSILSESIQKRIEEYDYLEEMELAVSELEAKEAMLKSVKSEIQLTEDFIIRYQKLLFTLPEVQKVIDLEPKVDEILNDILDYARSIEEINYITGMIDTLILLIKMREEAEELTSLEETTNGLLIECNDHNILTKENTELKTTISFVQLFSDSLVELDETIKTSESEFAKKMGRICLLCGQTIKTKKKES